MNIFENIVFVFCDKFFLQFLLVQGCGCINIIGEYIDYNDGFVLFVFINKYIYFVIVENGFNECYFYVFDINDFYQFLLDDIKKFDKGWVNYLMGILDQFQKEDILLEGVDVVFGGNLFIGFGMSFFVVLEVGFVLGICSLFNFQKSCQELVQLAYWFLNNFFGIFLGIMDQFVSLFGQCGQAIKLDCCFLQYEYV